MNPATPQLTGFHWPMKLSDVGGEIEEDLGRNRTVRTKLTIPECIHSSLRPRLQSSSTGTWECQTPTLCCLHTPMVEGNVPLCLQKTTCLHIHIFSLQTPSIIYVLFEHQFFSLQIFICLVYKQNKTKIIIFFTAFWIHVALWKNLTSIGYFIVISSRSRIFWHHQLNSVMDGLWLDQLGKRSFSYSKLQFPQFQVHVMFCAYYSTIHERQGYLSLDL